MPVLVIPDIHNKVDRVDEILAKTPHDRVIFLGDYFDEHGDTVLDARKTARWLRRRIENHPEDVFLFGNHDLSYAFQCRSTFCPGWNEGKHIAVNEEMRGIHWDALQFFHLEGEDWLFTHAGLTKYNFRGGRITNFQSFVKEEENRAQWKSRRRERCWVTMGGFQGDPGSGVLWCRPNEFVPIAKLNQVFGHTYHESPQLAVVDGFTQANLDTRLGFAGLFHGDRLETISV